jgi:Ca2+-binding RTX toxin-like protein
VDLLTGGAGADVFVLGDQRGIFYNDTISSDLGRRDYAQISDFRSGVDKVQLASAFYLTAVNNGTTSLYWDRTGNGQLNTSGIRTDELIAVFSNATLASGDLVWV